ncbi:hypothetical protein HZB69_00785 [Candidatus Amesbacteria bacterium]|nr:hypothetical protein [Candidatus Amesbacteria bacterium]
MFTNRMFERLSEWSANISILFIGSSLIPYLSLNKSTSVSADFLFGLILATGSLWLSLRLTRISERRM